MNTPETSALERFQALCAGTPVKVPLLDIELTPPWEEKLTRLTGSGDPTDALGADFVHISPRYLDDHQAWVEAYAELGVTLPEPFDQWIFGTVRRIPNAESMGDCSHLREWFHPLAEVETVEELEQLPWPDIFDDGHYAALAEAVAEAHSRGKVAVGALECTIFEYAWYLRGMENLFMDWMEDSEVSDWLLDWMTRRSCEAARRLCQAGVDIIRLGDDVGGQQDMMLSPDMWRQRLKPRLQKVIQTIREHSGDKISIGYHSDGNILRIIPELAEMGIDFLNPVQPECMDVTEVLRTFRDRIGFWGGVGTQTTMPFGTPAEVAAAVAHLRSLTAEGAKLIIAPTHVVEPDVPAANLAALLQACDRAVPDGLR